MWHNVLMDSTTSTAPVRNAMVVPNLYSRESVERLLERVQAYLPQNYSASLFGEGVLIFGQDNAGWTLDGYVIPRLASGLIYASEVDCIHDAFDKRLDIPAGGHVHFAPDTGRVYGFCGDVRISDVDNDPRITVVPGNPSNYGHDETFVKEEAR